MRCSRHATCPINYLGFSVWELALTVLIQWLACGCSVALLRSCASKSHFLCWFTLVGCGVLWSRSSSGCSGFPTALDPPCYRTCSACRPSPRALLETSPVADFTCIWSGLKTTSATQKFLNGTTCSRLEPWNLSHKLVQLLCGSGTLLRCSGRTVATIALMLRELPHRSSSTKFDNEVFLCF